jgi:hypothetical protein
MEIVSGSDVAGVVVFSSCVVAFRSGVVNMAVPGNFVDPLNDRHVAFAQDLIAFWMGLNVPLLVTMTPKIWVLL